MKEKLKKKAPVVLQPLMGHLLQRISPELVQVEYPQSYKIWLLQNRGLILLQVFSTVPFTNTDENLEILMWFQTSTTRFVAALLKARPENPPTSI